MSNWEEIIVKFLIVAAMGLSVLLLVLGGNGVREEIPDDDRTYKDPLPGSLRLLWPFVLFFSFYLGRFVSVEQLERSNILLRRAGVDYLMSPEQYFGLRCVAGMLFGVFAALASSATVGMDWVVTFVGVALGYFLPALALHERRKKRESDIVRMLPIYLDFFTMAVQAGMNLSGAITQAIDKGPGGTLHHELQRVIRDMKAGMSRLDALRAMADRLDIREITSFVSAVAQSEKTGSSIGETLKIQADQRRVERFQRAEKLAMEAPVKLIFPLVAFIFPMTFLVIGFPIAMMFIHGH